jgi:Co/Zn/Cd efflux system component
MKAVKEILFLIFFLYTIMLVVAYCLLLWDKIQRPTFKNMNNQEAIWLGLLALVFVTIDFFIAKRWISKIFGRS